MVDRSVEERAMKGSEMQCRTGPRVAKIGVPAIARIQNSPLIVFEAELTLYSEFVTLKRIKPYLIVSSIHYISIYRQMRQGMTTIDIQSDGHGDDEVLPCRARGAMTANAVTRAGKG
jgi:hypothetical protein